MRHSKIAHVVLFSKIFLSIIIDCVQGDNIYYPDLNVDDLFKTYPNLPPLDIIPGNSLVTPSTSIDELEKDLEIVNKHFEILSRDEGAKSDWSALYNLSRQYAFLRLLKYKDLKIKNTVTERLLKRYLHSRELIASLEDSKKTNDISLEGLIINKKYYDEFENKILKGQRITTVERDAELQSIWKSLSEKAGQEMKVYLDKYLKNIDAMTRKYGKIIGINDSLTFWHYYNDYDFTITNELKKLWKNELRLPYQKLMKYMRKDFSELYQYYTNIEEGGPIPAYIFDMIFLTHTVLIYDKYQGFTFPQIKKRFESIWNHEHAATLKYNVRTLTEEVQKFYESIGFPKLKKMFWRKSIFEYVGANGLHEFSLFYYEGDNGPNLAVRIRCTATFVSYQKILELLLDYHRRILLLTSEKPRILWDADSQAFQDAFLRAVMMSASSVRRITSLGFMKKDLLDEENQDWFKANAVTLFTGLAFAMTSHTWRTDMIGKNIGLKNRLAEYWNIRKRFEFVVPKTYSPEDANTHDLFDMYSGVRLLEDEFNLNHLAIILLQHQIFARFCEMAGQFNPKRPMDYPLDTCDISGNDKIGELIRTIMVDGPLKSWREAFDMIMGKPNSTISAKNGVLLIYANFFHNLEKKYIEKKE